MAGMKRMRTSGGQFMSAMPLYRRAGRMARAARRGIVPRGVASRVHAFKRVGEVMTIGSTAVATTAPALTGNAGSGGIPYLQIGSAAQGFIQFTQMFGGAFSFQLQQCAQVAEITNLFDNYRIKRVVLRFDYSQNSAPSAANTTTGQVSTNAVPLIHFCPDFDDNGIPASRADVLANGYVKTYRLDRSFSVSIVPRAQSSVAVSATTTTVGGMLPSSTWLDNSATQIPHYGGKFWIEDYNCSGVSSAALRITPIYYIEAKNVV